MLADGAALRALSKSTDASSTDLRRSDSHQVSGERGVDRRDLARAI